MDLALRNTGLDPTMIDVLYEVLDVTEESETTTSRVHAPSRPYMLDAKATACTPADVKELPSAYVFEIDMPGLKADRITVNVEEGNVLVVRGERRREKEKEKDQGVKYTKMERRLAKYLKKFVSPENADVDKISATHEAGVLTVVVQKRPPPEPKKPKTVEVQVV